jgi:hypothetical protein
MRRENVFPVTVLIGFDIRTGVAVGHLLTLAKKISRYFFLIS